VHGFAELAKQLALRFRELLRRLHDNLHHQVSAAMLVQMRHTLAAQAELLAGLRALVDPEHGISFKRRYMNLIAQRDLRKGNEDDAMKVIAIAFEELVRLYGQHDIEVALRPTGTPRVAFTLVANAGSIFHSSRYADTDGVAAVGQPCAVALETGIGDHLPEPLHIGQVRAMEKEALLVTHLSTAGALFAGFRAAAGGRPGTAAIGADLGAAELDLCLLAEDGLFELEREIVANVAAALRAPIATPSAHVEHFPEEVSEDISHVGVGKALEARCTRPLTPACP
jgi:hypothetical protein